jgi:hypothetical protein
MLAFWSSGMLFQVAGNLTYSDVLKNHSSFIFKSWYVLAMEINAKQHNIPEDKMLNSKYVLRQV